MKLLGYFRSKKRNNPPVENSALPLSEPPYYEVWGGLESANRALWVALWFALTVALLALLLLRQHIQRPPVVITVNNTGETQALADPGRPVPVSPAEIQNFLALFERFYTELNVYTYDRDLRLAFTMMTPAYQAKANDQLKSGGVIETLKTNQTRTRLFLGELRVVQETPELLQCLIKGYREIESYKPEDGTEEIVFEDEIILKKVPRSEQAPYGVLVEDYHESIFKKGKVDDPGGN